jgi:lysophospholipase L1-like esterase
MNHRHSFCSPRSLLLLLLAGCTASLSAAVPSTGPANLPWISAWGTAPDAESLDSGFAAAAYQKTNTFNNQTLRLVLHPSLSGSTIRLHFSNQLGTGDLTLSDVHVAKQSAGNSVNIATDTQLHFDGMTKVTIPAGSEVESDPVSFSLVAEQNVSVSIFIASGTAATAHVDALQTSYVSPSGSGDLTSAATMQPDPAQGTITSWPILSALDVQSPAAGAPAGTIVAFGASLTDGFHSTVNTNNRWPNVLEHRLQQSGAPFGMVDEGLAGNRLLTNGHGTRGLDRFSRDVLSRSSARYVIIADLPVNDIGDASPEVSDPTVAELINGYRQLIAMARARNLVVIGATLPPFGGSMFDDPTGVHNAKREQMNQWILSGGAFDGVVDFDAAVRDPSDPTRLLPAYDSGDHLHPNDAGYAAMARSVDLSLFKSDCDDLSGLW